MEPNSPSQVRALPPRSSSAPPVEGRRPSFTDSLSGIFYYVADAIAPYPESHEEGRRESIKANNEISTHVENVFTTVIQAVAPNVVETGAAVDTSVDTSDFVRDLFSGSENTEDVMARQIYDSILDTRTYEIEFRQGTCREAQNFIEKFYKLLSTVPEKWKDSDWIEFKCMVDVDDNLLWRRCILNQNGVPKKSKDAKTYACFEETFTTLHCAAAMGNVRLCQEILNRAPAVVDVVDRFGRQPLHIAAYWGNLEIVEMLKKSLTELYGIEPIGCHAPVDVSGWTPAIYAKMAEKNILLVSMDDRKLVLKTDQTFHELKEEARVTEIEKINLKKILEREGIGFLEKKKQLTPLVDKIKSLEATARNKTFKRCREILYAHGDHHVSPNSNRDSANNSPTHYHVDRVGDTPNRTKLRKGGGTPLRMEIMGNIKSVSGDIGMKQSVNKVEREKNIRNGGEVEQMIALTRTSKLVYGVASHHMTGFRSTQEDSVVVHFDKQQLWVSSSIHVSLLQIMTLLRESTLWLS
jgi:hypothetical protein